MATDVFIDTNVLLYAVSTAEEERAERQAARRILEADNWGLSVQVLQEFYVNATGKLAQTLSEAETLHFLAHVMRRPVVDLTPDLFLRAIELKNRYRIGYWDAAVVGAALTLGCHTLYTQDLNHGQDYDGLCAVDPFRPPA
jgi:predicted nucleic acid-binding protein